MKRRFILLVCLFACDVQAADSNAMYQRHATWAESMTATRQKVAQAQAQQLKLPAEQTDWNVVWEGLYRRFWTEWPETDWLLQDRPSRAAVDDFQPQREFGWYFEARRSATLEQELIRRVLAELNAAQEPLAARLEALIQASTSPDDPAW